MHVVRIIGMPVMRKRTRFTIGQEIALVGATRLARMLWFIRAV
jgi:hypothetical protein